MAGVAAVLAVPAEAPARAAGQVAVAPDRSAGPTVASRSEQRSALASRTALAAEVGPPAAPVRFGVSGVVAVPRPVVRKPARVAAPPPASRRSTTVEPGSGTAGASATPGRAGRGTSTSTATARGTGSSTAYSTTRYAGAGAALGLAPSAQRVYSAVRSRFGITTIGGLRPGDDGDHGTGHAVDVMVRGSRGDAVAAFAIANARALDVTYVIWEQRIWMPGRGWEPMADRGSDTANHVDHVHVSVD
ncbi:MAG TPA: hypothetical protein VES95_02685 [Dermatophilaceae bacterium]|nr:hypothetical protein [Dermatophilaceae bacterium]